MGESFDSRDSNGMSHGNSSGLFRTTCPDTSGLTTGSASKSNFSGKGSYTHLREASCRITGPVSSHGTRTLTPTRSDTSSRYTGKFAGRGAWMTGTHVPVPPTGTKKQANGLGLCSFLPFRDLGQDQFTVNLLDRLVA